MAAVHLCIDCKKDPPATVRKLWNQLKPGDPPRCGEHGRAWRDRRRKLSSDRRIETFGGITAEEYWKLYEAQGRKCAIPLCRATGKVKRLAIDHNHELAARECDHDPKTKACRRCIRGLLCGPHNQELIGKYRVDLADALEYLRNPPARRHLAQALLAEDELDPVG